MAKHNTLITSAALLLVIPPTAPQKNVREVLEAARQQVETTGLPLQKIATDTGFCDPERMRVAFLRAYGQPPMVLRRQSKSP